MSMRTDEGDEELDEINVTPMVDLFMVLMLIFIIMTTTQLAGLKVHLPSAQSKSNLDKAKTIAITVSNDGKIFYDSYPVTESELEGKLVSQKAQTPDVQIVVRGDDKAEYQKIVAVLDVLQRTDISKVGLVIKPHH
jgi:biopolymer transport protein ExbD